MNNAQLINQDSGNTEYFTDLKIVNAARRTMGSINLDPASSFLANERIKADTYYKLEMEFSNDGRLIDINGGIGNSWFGNVWLNHPFARSESPCRKRCSKTICQERGYHTDTYIDGNKEWIEKLLYEYNHVTVNQACCITFAATSETWFKPLLKYPQCYLSPRTNYFKPNGTKLRGVTKGSVVTYLGIHVDRFYEEFENLGAILIPYTGLAS